MSEPVAWYVRHSANEPPLLFTDAERAKKAAFSCGCGAKPLYLSQVSPQGNSTDKPTKADVDRLLERIDSSQRTLVFEQEAEIARLKSRLRFCDAVIRSGDVAALTDAEREVIEAILVDPDSAPANSAATLRGLLNRLTPQHSQLP